MIVGNEENEIGPELKSIDIARDYLLYSAQKYGSEKPTYQAEISWYDDTTEKYPQVLICYNCDIKVNSINSTGDKRKGKMPKSYYKSM